MRRFVMFFYVVSLLAPPLAQIGNAARRAWWPWLEDICSSDARHPGAPHRYDASWVSVARLTIRRD